VSYEIELKELPDQYVATIRTTTTPDQIGETFRELLPEVDAEILNAGALPAGPSFALFHEYHEDQVDMEAGFRIEEPIPTSGRVIGRELLAHSAAVTFHHGPYEGIQAAHRAVEDWLRDQGKELAGAPWEVYWVGPGDDPDSSKWNTEVGYPFQG